MSYTSRFAAAHKTFTRVAAPLALALSIGGAASLAVAQGNAAPAAAPAATGATSAAPALNLRQIYDRIEAAGYRDIREIEWDDGRYEAKASNAQGQRMKLYVNATSGAIEHAKLHR
ncbi:PepSY domain-containing protein [Diaphorobacter caeni]|uniref:PepSY domain-containing protein n=1 Tax=Diaphorobacter caeni TaxID=2784387 RepID=UPI00188FDF4B|nr:PepSY domain-containing protein [Diaphorobacter caeni]MBF5003542.1 PepSY domain-containing protein [Diaphorobacter caeni]